MFERLNDEGWASNPVGPLAYHWRTGTGQSAAYLTNIAAAITRLATNITRKSESILFAKLAPLLRPASKIAFEESLAEVEVGAVLSGNFSPISIEPMVPEELHDSPNRPVSPDYGLKLPETLVTVEVTVWHWERLARWEKMVQEIHRAIHARMAKAGVVRDMRAAIPLSAIPATRELMTSRSVCKEIAEAHNGILEFDVGADRNAKLEWQTLLHFPNQESIDWDLIRSTNARAWTVGPNIAHQFSFAWNPELSLVDMESGLDSLRRSIDRKRRQSIAELPNFVAVALHSGRANWNWFSPMIVERLWPNSKYHWLSGLMEYTPARLLPPPQGQGMLNFNINPQADRPAPPSIVRAAATGEQFHWR